MRPLYRRHAIAAGSCTLGEELRASQSNRPEVCADELVLSCSMRSFLVSFLELPALVRVLFVFGRQAELPHAAQELKPTDAEKLGRLRADVADTTHRLADHLRFDVQQRTHAAPNVERCRRHVALPQGEQP